MRSQRIFMIGFLVVVGGVIAGLWKAGILEKIGTFWTFTGIAIAVGIGIMLAVSRVGSEVKIDK